MALPAMVGSDETLMSGPGMQGADPDQGKQEVNPQEQAKGAVQLVSQLRQYTQSHLEALATQFPSVSEAAQRLQQAMDQGLQNLVRELIKTAQDTAQPGPRVVR
jgi:hypothetical protein